MKKIFTLFIALMSTFAGLQNLYALTYTVTVPAGTEACYIAGAMNGWNAVANPMTKVDATHFSISFPNALTTDEYKYLSGPDWKYEELTADGNALPANRTWATTDVVGKWKNLYKKSFEKDVFIEVLVPNTVKVCYMTGSFNNWSTGVNQMTKGTTSVDGTIFSTTIHAMDTTTLEFKFLAGPTWSYEQTDPSTNFVYVTHGGTVVVNAFKAIFDPAKTGSITITATVPNGTDKVWIMGDFLSWNMDNVKEMTKGTDGKFTYTTDLVMSIEYRLYNKPDWAYPEVGEADPTKELPNRKAAFETNPNVNITVWGWKTPTGVKELELNGNITINEGVISAQEVNDQVMLYDLCGRVVDQQFVSGTYSSPKMKAGVYLLNIGSKVAKILVR